MKEGFTFDDVLIVPKFSFIDSRKEVDLSSRIHSTQLSLPVISANMDTITTAPMANAMAKAGGMGCLHRFGSIEDTVALFKESNSKTAVSIGLGTYELDRAAALKEVGANTFIIDVAHGAQMSVVTQANRLRKLLGDSSSIIVGNFASLDSIALFLAYCTDHKTIDGIKVGIGPGSACTTRIKTGVGFPQLSAVMEIAQGLKNSGLSIIADGGMKTPGDIAKALAAGAHLVMVGGMLAGTDETPGETQSVTVRHGIYGEPLETKLVKKYRGSASKESYDAQGKDSSWRTAEGESFMVPYKGSVGEVLKDIEGGIRSSMTYVGAKNLREFRENAQFVKISNSTVRENGAHGKG